MSDKIHGNSKDSKKPQHLYEITDNEEDDTFKYGISGEELNKNGTSNRANAQVNKLNLIAGIKKFFAKILNKDIDGRATALELEKQYVQDYFDKHGHNPIGNKRPQGKK